MKADAMRLIWLVAVIGILTGTGRGEGSCFRTPTQAGVQVGELEGGGYRLVFVRLDRFSGRSWAGVRSCVHPEWPALLVAGGLPVLGYAPEGKAFKDGGRSAAPDIVGGKTVKVLQANPLVRIEMGGVAQASGYVGDRIWVRMLGPGNEGNAHFELAVIRSRELVEVGQ